MCTQIKGESGPYTFSSEILGLKYKIDCFFFLIYVRGTLIFNKRAKTYSVDEKQKRGFKVNLLQSAALHSIYIYSGILNVQIDARELSQLVKLYEVRAEIFILVFNQFRCVSLSATLSLCGKDTFIVFLSFLVMGKCNSIGKSYIK